MLRDTVALQPCRAHLELITTRAAVDREVGALRDDQHAVGAAAAPDAVALAGLDAVGAASAGDPVGGRGADETVGARRTAQLGGLRGNGVRHDDGERAGHSHAHAPERMRHRGLLPWKKAGAAVTDTAGDGSAAADASSIGTTRAAEIPRRAISNRRLWGRNPSSRARQGPAKGPPERVPEPAYGRTGEFMSAVISAAERARW